MITRGGEDAVGMVFMFMCATISVHAFTLSYLRELADRFTGQATGT